MLAEAQHPVTTDSGQAAAVAARAVSHAETVRVSGSPGPDEVAAARAILRAAKAAKPAPSPEVLHGWKPPADWRPFASFADAMRAHEEAQQACRDACRARIALSAPYIEAKGPGAYDYMMSRTPEEAEAKNPLIPKDLIAASKAERAASAAYDVVRQRAAVTPATGLEIIEKLRLIIRPLDDVLDPKCAEDMRVLRRRPDEFPIAVEVASLHDDLIRAFAPPERTAWDAGLATLAAAERAYAEHDRLCDALDAAVTALAPAEIIRPAEGDSPARVKWCNVLNFERTHEPDEADLRPVVEAFFARAEVTEAVARKDEAYQQCDDLLDAISDAEDALFRLPAPDLGAVLWKQDRYGLLTDDDRQGYADPIRVAAIRDGYGHDRWPLFIHEDMLRLTGTPSPLLTRHPFSPAAWSRAFKAVGGTINLDREQMPSEAQITTPFNDENTADALRLLEELNTGDNRAVLLAWLREVY